MNELLFKGYYTDNKVAFTGYTLVSIAASFSKEEIAALRIFLWTELKDWRGHNIYVGDQVVNVNPKTTHRFIGTVEYCVEMGKFIIKGEKRYLDLTDSTMSGGEQGTYLNDVEIIGNSIQN